ncbi:MAG: hypothetical protein AAF902_05750 [Chloroflexota bacterium]
MRLSKNKVVVYALSFVVVIGILILASQLSKLNQRSNAEVGLLFLRLVNESNDAVYSISSDHLEEPIEAIISGKDVPTCLKNNVVNKKIYERSDGVMVTCSYLSGRTKVNSQLLIAVNNGVVVSIGES